MSKQNTEKEKWAQIERIRELEWTTGKYYVPRDAIPRAIPAGYVLVHNSVPHSVNTLSSTNGFLGWFQKPSDRLKACTCGWAGLPHYRVKRNVARA